MPDKIAGSRVLDARADLGGSLGPSILRRVSRYDSCDFEKLHPSDGAVVRMTCYGLNSQQARTKIHVYALLSTPP